MKLKISISLLFLSTLTIAQVGVGTTAPNAQLDIQSSNPINPTITDGILIPKVASFSSIDPGLNQQGMLVYLTTATVYKTVNKPSGFYYWDNVTANWIQIQTGNSNLDWGMTGNAGTNTTTNFIGTTDNTDIVFKRNNVRAGFIGNPDTSAGGGKMNTSFGANSLLAITTGVRNTAVGTNVLSNNTSGERNTAIGEQTMFSNTTGLNNTAIGVGSLYSNTTASDNVAVGRNALTASNGNGNTALGFRALNDNQSGANNIAIGYNAGYREMGSNKLYIHSSSSNTLANTGPQVALIYGEFDNKILRVNGNLQINNPATTGYVLPVTRGTAGQMLQTDGLGGTNWSSTTVKPFTTTGMATGIYDISVNEYTIRVYNDVSEVRLPSAPLNPGKVFIIIGSNGIGTKILSSVSGGVYDDATSSSITSIGASDRYMVQSDGIGWIVIGN
jgi:hypothetical protein